MAQILKYSSGGVEPKPAPITSVIKDGEETITNPNAGSQDPQGAQGTDGATDPQGSQAPAASQGENPVTFPSITINGKSYTLDDAFKQGVYDYIETFDDNTQYYMKSLFNLYTDGTSVDSHTHIISGIDLNKLNIPKHKKRKLGRHQTSADAFFNSEDMNN